MKRLQLCCSTSCLMAWKKLCCPLSWFTLYTICRAPVANKGSNTSGSMQHICVWHNTCRNPLRPKSAQEHVDSFGQPCLSPHEEMLARWTARRGQGADRGRGRGVVPVSDVCWVYASGQESNAPGGHSKAQLQLYQDDLPNSCSSTPYLAGSGILFRLTDLREPNTSVGSAFCPVINTDPTTPLSW